MRASLFLLACLACPSVPQSDQLAQRGEENYHAIVSLLLSSTRWRFPMPFIPRLARRPLMEAAPDKAYMEGAAERVQSWLRLTPDATMLPLSACAPDIVFTGDLPSSYLKGATEYAQASRTWNTLCKDLLGESYETSVERVAELSVTEVVIRWRATWSLEKTLWLETLASFFSWEVQRFDLDPRVVSTFSWSAIAKLFATAVTTGRIALPRANIDGLSTLRLDPNSGKCVAHRESIDAVGLATASSLLNRRVAANVAEFLDIRRPPNSDPDEWAAMVKNEVLSGVPGAGDLDIEPPADEREGYFALLLFSFILLLFSSVFASIMFDI